MTVANWITLSRLLVAPVMIGILAVDSSPFSRWICLGLFLGAALTDWLDGYVARRFNQVSDLGKILDPLVDKLLVLAPLLALVQLQEIPAWTVFLILLRELGIAGWRVNQTQISGANLWGKVKTVTQIIAVAALLVPEHSILWQWGAWGAYGLAITLTWISGLIYLWPQPKSPLSPN
ncbi:CDP-diacylglycerol--glycerol-3-phosphate 3-phosphatidyltransferase [Thermosynechococcaceae cyanobacterium BACA0444]|uniref:CDP-diacylglycerol--glycerol-3-phosphate 3-phosphatidyltransferase n=1 Tax=Pseudocalidococcus azoricus BACA0444 TaxID=2918990 RepID=A0AAE4FV11_9CYAN|nr:CDP-diacylglycerol--glycerol-3-phosphate 3-phosphatidyltransferase [Pseudocalidococcus azoricus]MDS3861797.1 CDP-diacylglycerol--glycerol-3-phosphate 3-phosphatidyltransferase [Pseudocalidococcus azoricus BACA0444]